MQNSQLLIRISFVLLYFMVKSFTNLCSQSFQPHFYHYTVEDGLPSSEVYCSMQDNEGYLWFGTDNGVARFNGYEFKVYNTDNGLKDVVVFKILQDDAGVIWVSTFSGGIYYFKNGHFYGHPHNKVLENFKKNTSAVTLINPDFRDGFLLSVDRGSLLYWDGEEAIVELEDNFLKEINFYENSNDLRNRMYAYSGKPYEVKSSKLPVYRYANDQDKWVLHAEVPNGFHLPQVVWLGNNGESLIHDAGKLSYIDSRRSNYQLTFPNVQLNFVYPLADTSLLLGMGGGHGIYHLQKFTNSKEVKRHVLLKGRSIAHIYKDQNGGMWVATLDAGIYYAPDPSNLFYNKENGLPDVKPLSVSAIDTLAFFCGFSDRSVQYFDPENGVRNVLKTGISFNSIGVYYDRIGKTLYGNFDPIKILKKPTGIIARYTSYKPYTWPSGVQTIQVHQQGGVRRLYATASQRAREYNLNNDTVTNSIIKSIDKRLPRMLSFMRDWDGRLLLGTLHGLYEYLPEQDTLIENFLGNPIFEQRIQAILPLEPDAMLFGTRGDGLIYRDPDTLFTITTKDGLAANMVRKIHIDERGVVWVATLAGLSEVDFRNVCQGDRKEYQNISVRTYTAQHGLPSEEILSVDTYDEYVWLVTNKGILRFKPPGVDSFSSVPKLERVSIDGIDTTAFALAAMKSEPKELRLTFAVLSYSQLGKVPYRYRLQEAGSWLPIGENELSFFSLQPDNYKLEIQAQNADGFWSESLIVPINIPIPWYTRWPALVAGFLLSTFSIGTFFWLRELRRKEAQRLNDQINELERSALHAQMNPHFVFNSLTSIQNYILKKDTISAVNYLGQFAQLIRSTLKVSVLGKHSLADEIMMLEDYIALEKLRFPNGFDYEIEVADDLDEMNILLPPLMLQPFIENAIKHGLEQNASGGEINVFFSGGKDKIIARILDNGRGYNPEMEQKENSFGMKITQRRLELMQKYAEILPPLQVQLRYDVTGKVIGTEVTIIIPVSSAQ